jgi:hypothetical protein
MQGGLQEQIHKRGGASLPRPVAVRGEATCQAQCQGEQVCRVCQVCQVCLKSGRVPSCGPVPYRRRLRQLSRVMTGVFSVSS